MSIYNEYNTITCDIDLEIIADSISDDTIFLSLQNVTDYINRLEHQLKESLLINENIAQFNRFEVIDNNGRQYVRSRGVKQLKFSPQDGGKTLKVFVK